MDVLLNIIIIFFILLIAYWWANQGFFSSILHFVAVVCAGAIAFAFWEPLVVGLVLQNSGFDNYAWGMILIALFMASLVVIRVAFDRLAPANVIIPHWANLAFGGLFGVGSAILTVGILMIAIGFTQSSNKILGMQGWARSGNGIEKRDTLWLPVHEWTIQFFEVISTGAFYPDFTREPLKQVNPDLAKVSWALYRDSYKDGTSRTSIVPDAVTIKSVVESNDRYFVKIQVSIEGFDHASQFVMSNAQIRMLAFDGTVSRGKVYVGHPEQWTQLVLRGSEKVQETFRFDDKSHYVTSIPGRQEVEFQVEFKRGGREFEIPTNARPVFILLKGVRYRIPTITRGQEASARGVERGGRAGPANPNAAMARAEDIKQRKDIRPFNSLSVNNIQGTLQHTDRMLISGYKQVRRGRPGGGRLTRILGISATEGAQIVRVDVSRQSTADIYGPIRDQAGENATPKLVDSDGIEYLAKGYLSATPDMHTISLTPGSPIRSIDGLPHLPTNETHRLWLIYEVTEGVTITSFRLDDVTVVNCNVTIQLK